MFFVRFPVAAFIIAFVASGGSPAYAQLISTRYVRIVTSEPGSTNDWTARIMAQDLTKALGHTVIVENRGNMAIEYAAKATPDGNTLLYYGNSVWIQPLFRSAPYDPVKDLAAVTLATISPSAIVVHPSVPVKSVKELLDLAKAKPGVLNCAAGSIGASSHLSMELFKSMAGIDIVRVPYKGTGPSVTAILAGQVHMMFSPLGSVTNHIKSGKLRILAIGNERASELAPNVPTIAESGVPGYESSSITGMFAPGNTPSAIVQKVYQEIVRGLSQPGVKEKFLGQGMELVLNSPEEFSARVKSEMAKWGKVIKEAGLREE
jgi:tripartite-type tricarboxylate transporter receptor subunit TctC